MHVAYHAWAAEVFFVYIYMFILQWKRRLYLVLVLITDCGFKSYTWFLSVLKF